MDGEVVMCSGGCLYGYPASRIQHTIFQQAVCYGLPFSFFFFFFFLFFFCILLPSLFLFLIPSSYSSPFASSFLPIHHHRGRYPFRTARWSTRRVPSLIPSSVFRAVHQNVAKAKPRTPVSVLA